MRAFAGKALIAAALVGFASAAAAQAPESSVKPRVQGPSEALAEDASEYARQSGVTLTEAIRRLRAQEESVAATDRLQELYRDRLAGISIEHSPEYWIVVLLTGSEPVPDQFIRAGGMDVPVVFRTGASATRDEIVAAIRQHQARIRTTIPRAQGMGLDPRTGELVILTQSLNPVFHDAAAIEEELEGVTGVPVRLRILDAADTDLSIGGGSRVEGTDPANGRRYACTTGFVVTDGARTGVVTAAHCPDTLTYYDPDGEQIPLAFVGQWGIGYQDVQVHVSSRAESPLFFADSRKSARRMLTGWRNRTSTRAGDAVCKRGETTGYSCSQVELTDFAPPGDLCAGPCDPVWVTVTGPSCRSGDSGGPIFNGTVAFGITKGGSYSRGKCSFYYYMSTDYLPEGWSLLHG